MMALTFTDEFLAKYDGLEPLGEGGMGTVYRGVQRSLERPVAIKFLSRQLLDEEYMCRFRSEAKLAGQVFHTNLVAVIETGSMGDVPFIVFELVEGASLREHVRRAGGSLSLREALDVVRQVAEGLAVAHGIGIVHRDIKPENILVGAKGVKVADFGVAKNAAASASQKTRSGVIMGTPAYMSPEQAREQELTGASDMYALGVVLHELLSGMLPFQKSSTLELLQAIVSEPPPPVPAHVPRAVAALSSAMLAKEPGARPSSMADLARELCRLIESPEVAGAARVNATGSTAAVAPVTNPRPAAQATLASRPQPVAHGATLAVVPEAAPAAIGTARAVILAVGITMLVCAAAASAWIRRRPVPPPPSATPSPFAIASASTPPASASPSGHAHRLAESGGSRRRTWRRGLGSMMEKADENQRALVERARAQSHQEALEQTCGGAEALRVNPQPSCRIWAALAEHDVVKASRGISALLEKVRQNPRLGLVSDLKIFNVRAFERMACELFAKPAAEGRAAADAIVQVLTGTVFSDGVAGVRDLVHGGDRLPAALASFRRVPEKYGVTSDSGLVVLEALALAVTLKPGWGADKEARAAAENALDSCESYLEIWQKADLRPVAGGLAEAFAIALERPVLPGAHGPFPPERRATCAGRLEKLTGIAVAHIRAGQPDAVLPPDPEY